MERENDLRDFDPLRVLVVRGTSVPVLRQENEKAPNLEVELAGLEKYYGNHVPNDYLASDLLRNVRLAEFDDAIADGEEADNPAAYNANHCKHSSNPHTERPLAILVEPCQRYGLEERSNERYADVDWHSGLVWGKGAPNDQD